MPVLNIPQVAKRLDHASISVTIADMRRDDTPLIYANAAFAQMTSYAAHEVLHRNCRFLQGNLDNHAARAAIRSAIERGASAQATFANLRRDGQPLHILLLVEPLTTRDGTLAYMVGSQFRVTHRTTDEDVGAHGKAVSTEIDRLLELNESLRATNRRSLAKSAQAAVKLWMDR